MGQDEPSIDPRGGFSAPATPRVQNPRGPSQPDAGLSEDDLLDDLIFEAKSLKDVLREVHAALLSHLHDKASSLAHRD